MAARARKMRDNTDPQKQAIYAWETKWKDWDRETLTLRELRETVRTACKQYAVPPPTKILQHNSRAWSWYKDGLHRGGIATISFQRAQSNPAVALHETAHHIVFHYFGETVPDHGPTFLGVYLWLLEKHHVAPREALHASARADNLRWSEISPKTCKFASPAVF